MATDSLIANFTANVRGGDAGDKDVSITWNITTPLEATMVETLTNNADNTITLPNGCTLAVIIPPSDNTQTILLKKVAGDTGITLQPDKPSVIAIASTQFVINVATGIDLVFKIVCI